MVALPGETVSVVDGQLHIDGEAVENPEGLQKEYRVVFGTQAEAQLAYPQIGVDQIGFGTCQRHPRGHCRRSWL